MNEVKINMKKHCKDCALFEPVFGCKTASSTTIVQCQHRDICDAIEKKLLKEMREEREKKDSVKRTTVDEYLNGQTVDTGARIHGVDLMIIV